MNICIIFQYLNILCAVLLPSFYLVNTQQCSFKHVFPFKVENSVDPDLTVCQKSADMDK